MLGGGEEEEEKGYRALRERRGVRGGVRGRAEASARERGVGGAYEGETEGGIPVRERGRTNPACCVREMRGVDGRQ